MGVAADTLNVQCVDLLLADDPEKVPQHAPMADVIGKMGFGRSVRYTQGEPMDGNFLGLFVHREGSGPTVGDDDDIHPPTPVLVRELPAKFLDAAEVGVESAGEECDVHFATVPASLDPAAAVAGRLVTGSRAGA